MKRTVQGVLLAGSLVLGGGALAQGSAQGAEMRSDKAQAGGKTMGKAEMGKAEMAKAPKGMAEHMGVMVPTDPKAFLERLHMVNQTEIQLAKLAETNSQNEDVKAFARAMIQEHTTQDQKLMQYAQSKGLKLAEKPKPMNDLEKKSMAAHLALMDKLKSARGAAFDACYIANQVADHDDTHAKIMAMMHGGGAGSDAEMTAMLQELHTKLPQHREHAYSVLGKLDDKLMQGMGGAGDGSMGGATGGTMGGHGSHGTPGSTGTAGTPGSPGTPGAQGQGQGNKKP